MTQVNGGVQIIQPKKKKIKNEVHIENDTINSFQGKYFLFLSKYIYYFS